ncbi:Rgg/GadR/MutR family transcriptional activator [Streptococcus rupicaprae]|uniref:Rgg/GadR/MutR family transcriptional activator n=1 Tax=Streptococcus rupicaprae TaxID=759619 RepID=A0ABV2FK75_9STRE
MSQYGEIFRLLREGKKLSLKEVAGSEISTAQLSRFETGKSQLTLEVFFTCLQRMSISYEEFSLYLQQEPESNLSQELMEAYYNGDLKRIQEIEIDWSVKCERNPDITKYRLDLIMIQIAKYYCNTDDVVSEENIRYLMDYLFKIEEWGEYERWLFSNAYAVFPSSSLELLAQELLSKSQKYFKNTGYRQEVAVILLHLVSAFLERKEFEKATLFLNTLHDFPFLEEDTHIRLGFRFYWAYFAYLTGYHNAKIEMEKCIEVAQFLSCDKISQTLQAIFKDVTDM